MQMKAMKAWSSLSSGLFFPVFSLDRIGWIYSASFAIRFPSRHFARFRAFFVLEPTFYMSSCAYFLQAFSGVSRPFSRLLRDPRSIFETLSSSLPHQHMSASSNSIRYCPPCTVELFKNKHFFKTLEITP